MLPRKGDVLIATVPEVRSLQPASIGGIWFESDLLLRNAPPGVLQRIPQGKLIPDAPDLPAGSHTTPPAQPVHSGGGRAIRHLN